MTECKSKELDNNHVCVDCQTPSPLLANLHIEISQVAQMFYTISPDSELYDYNQKLPDKQKKSLDHRFNEGIKEIEKHLKIYGWTVHYEFNKQGNLHTHGLIYVPIEYEGYNKNTILVSKIFNRYFGRPRLSSMIACKVEWPKDILNVCNYVNKENAYTPIHKVNEVRDLTKYLKQYNSAPSGRE